MIYFERKNEGFIDEQFGGALVRRYANTIATGYLSALNISPSSDRWSDVVNVDVVLTEYPRFLSSRFDFEYSDRRSARRAYGIGKFAHLHLSASAEQLNYLISQIGKNIKLAGDEIAIQRDGKSWFFIDVQATAWLGLPDDHDLSKTTRKMLADAPQTETQCHSIFLRAINNQSSGSGTSGHFATASAAAVGGGGQIAKDAIQRAKKARAEREGKTDAGKDRSAADRLDMDDRMQKMRKQRGQ